MRSTIVFCILALVACSDDAETKDTTSTTGSGSGTKCYDVAVNETNDGSSACGPEVCPGGDYCVSDVGICDPGCRNELECPRGQTCDLSNAGANGIGLCRVPGPEHEVPCTTTKTCGERCGAKATQCMAPPDVGMQYCGMLCPTLSNDQIDCLEMTSCQELEQLMQGQTVCGIMPPE